VPLTSNTANTVNDIVDHLLADCVVSTRIVVSGILLAADQQLGVEQLAVATSPDLIDGRRVEVDKDGAGDIFAIAGLGEESLERAAITDVLGIWVGTTVGSQAVLKEVPGSREMSKES